MIGQLDKTYVASCRIDLHSQQWGVDTNKITLPTDVLRACLFGLTASDQ